MKLGVDAVNLSLGSPAGFTSRPDMLSTMTNLEKAGIVVAAAGNEYTAAYKNLWENDNCKALEQVYFLGNPPENVSTRMFVSKVADMTVYYDAALAAQWAPEGETTWCGYPLAATIFHKVVHKDINHETLLDQYVADGQSVGAVSSHIFSKLTTGHTIRAEFEPITFTVPFVDGITGETLDTQTVAYGKDAAAPQAPQHEGYTFSGRDAAFTNVRSGLTVTAQYDKNSEPTTPDQPEPGQPNQPDQPDQPDDGKQADKPATGDSFSAGWLALTLFSGATAACMVLLRRKKAD